MILKFPIKILLQHLETNNLMIEFFSLFKSIFPLYFWTKRILKKLCWLSAVRTSLRQFLPFWPALSHWLSAIQDSSQNAIPNSAQLVDFIGSEKKWKSCWKSPSVERLIFYIFFLLTVNLGLVLSFIVQYSQSNSAVPRPKFEPGTGGSSGRITNH